MTPAALSDVTRRFGGFTAVDGVSLHVGPGEVVGLLGANGAGKTTLIRVLLGLLPPTLGSVRVLGEAPSSRTRSRIGYVPQSLGLYPDLTVAENLAFVAAAYGVAAPPAPAGIRDTLVRDLPLGVRRRVAFQAAMAHAPELLVLDEPTSGMAPLARARLWDGIHRAADSGVAVLVTTHHLDEAEQCDRLVVLAAGRVVASGTVGDVVGGRTVVEVRVPDWERAFHVLDGSGLQVGLTGTRLRVAGASEEEVEVALASASLPADVATVPATLDEAFVRLAAAA